MKVVVSVAILVVVVNGQLRGLPATITNALTDTARNAARRVQAVTPNVGGNANINLSTSPETRRLVAIKKTRPKLRNLDALEETLDKEWQNFKIQYNKSYATPQEDLHRKEIFIENRQRIVKFNEDYAFGLTSYVLKLNTFGDLLNHEFNNLLNGFQGGNKKDYDVFFKPSTFISPINVDKPKSIDWRELGGVTPVKYQGQCASCHAFSAVGAVEGHNFRKTGSLVELSPQNLLDCVSEKYQSFGCAGGGYVDEDFKYIKENPGVDLESAYPYQGVDDTCKFDEDSVGANITGYVELPEGDELALETAVATLGPVSVGVDAGQMSFQFYSQGIYYDENCRNRAENINHAMLVVGYGEEPDGQKYWLVKNSYGPGWGLAGYIKIAKDVNNHCGIATNAVYPLV